MVGKRTYNDGCVAAHALDLIGERWALLVARELTLGPQRFTDLRAGLPTISPNVLSQRLEELEAAGIVFRRKLPPPAPASVYQLTEWGSELEPLIRDLGRWASRSPLRPQGLPMSIASFTLSLRTMFSSERAGKRAATIDLRLGDQPLQAIVSRGRFEIRPGASAAPDAVIVSDPNTLAGVIYGGRELNEAVETGDIVIQGDRPLIEAFVTFFPLPRPSSPPDETTAAASRVS